MLRNRNLLALRLGLCIRAKSFAAAAPGPSPSIQEARYSSNNGQSHHHPIPMNKRTAQEVMIQLNLAPNTERGYYVETFRDTDNVTEINGGNADRAASTAIYYLLEGSESFSNWHRVDAVEVWHYYAGAPLTLSLALDDGSPVREVKLGPDIFDGQQPQVPIAKREWQRARSWGAWTLVGTTGEFRLFPIWDHHASLSFKLTWRSVIVAPGLVPAGFEQADPDWAPNAP